MSKGDSFFFYLPVSDDVILRGLYLTSAGQQHTKPKEHFPPEQHPLVYHFKWEEGRTLPEFALVLFTDGCGEFESKKVPLQRIEPNDMVLITPGQWHRYHPDPQTGYTERWICFNGELPHDLLDRGLLDPVDTIMHVQDPSSLIAQFDRLLQYIRERHSTNTIAMTHHAMGLLGNALVTVDSEQDAHQAATTTDKRVTSDPLVSDALDLIWSRSHGTLTVAQVVSRLPATRRTLERHFQSVLGRSILDKINKCRLSWAKRLLCETNLIMKRVAYLSGFSCPDRMRLAFLKYMDLTPTRYRDGVRKQISK